MSINDIVTAWAEAKETEKIISARVKELSAQILEYSRGADCFETDDYTVTIKATESLRLDTKSLYADFPDIKREYGKTTISRSVSAFRKTDAGKKTA